MVASSAGLLSKAHQLANECQLPLLSEKQQRQVDYLLVVNAYRVQLQATQKQNNGAVYAEFLGGKAGYRRYHGGGRKQVLARAVGLSKPHPPTWILDATAGLGRDAFVLACLGCKVRMYERSAVVRALLHDGLARARVDNTVAKIVQSRMELKAEDAQSALLAWTNQERPEVIYLDPMYPNHEKRALVKKEMRFFRAVVGDDNDAPALLSAALAVARKRVVVKRPSKGTVVGQETPSFVVSSPNTRYDIYSLL